MDLATLLGFAIAFASILGGMVLEGGHLSSLYVPVAALIVYGGTVGAVMVQSTFLEFSTGVKRYGWIFFNPPFDLEGTAAKLVEWANIARKDGLLGLEEKIDTEEDMFTKTTLQMVVDGTDAPTISGIMELQIEAMALDYKQSMKVWEGMGGFAPTIGIIGAVLGLIHVMGNLDDPAALGPGIAVAFVATIYGLLGANVLFLPPAAKIATLSGMLLTEKWMILDGLTAITNGDNPRNIETKLKSYSLSNEE